MRTFKPTHARWRALVSVVAVFTLIGGASACGVSFDDGQQIAATDTTQATSAAATSSSEAPVTDTTKPSDEELGDFNSALYPDDNRQSPPGEIPWTTDPLGNIVTGGCWPKDETVDTNPETNKVGFAHTNGQVDAARYLRGEDPRDTAQMGKSVAQRYHDFWAQHRDYYLYDGQSAEDFASYVQDKTVAVQLPYDITVLNHRCEGPNVLLWQFETFQAGEWVYFLKGYEPGNPDHNPIKPIIRGACGNPLLPPPPALRKNPPPDTPPLTFVPPPPVTQPPPHSVPPSVPPSSPPPTVPPTTGHPKGPSVQTPCVDNMGVVCTPQPGAGGSPGNGGAQNPGNTGYTQQDPPPPTIVPTAPPPTSALPPPSTAKPPPPNSTLPPPPG